MLTLKPILALRRLVKLANLQEESKGSPPLTTLLRRATSAKQAKLALFPSIAN